jgi:hypothetical protein
MGTVSIVLNANRYHCSMALSIESDGYRNTCQNSRATAVSKNRNGRIDSATTGSALATTK